MTLNHPLSFKEAVILPLFLWGKVDSDVYSKLEHTFVRESMATPEEIRVGTIAEKARVMDEVIREISKQELEDQIGIFTEVSQTLGKVSPLLSKMIHHESRTFEYDTASFQCMAAAEKAAADILYYLQWEYGIKTGSIPREGFAPDAETQYFHPPQGQPNNDETYGEYLTKVQAQALHDSLSSLYESIPAKRDELFSRYLINAEPLSAKFTLLQQSLSSLEAKMDVSNV